MNDCFLAEILEGVSEKQSQFGGMEALPLDFFARPAQIMCPELVGRRLVKPQPDGSLIWGVVVETEAYS